MAKPRVSFPWLYIDGVSSYDLILALIGPTGVEKNLVVPQGVKTENFLPAIKKFLGAKIPGGVVVARGGGTFTQTRVCCAIANALAFGWGIGIAAVQVGKIPNASKKIKWGQIVLPKYSGPGVH